jgi:hypothetical protein
MPVLPSAAFAGRIGLLFVNKKSNARLGSKLRTPASGPWPGDGRQARKEDSQRDVEAKRRERRARCLGPVLPLRLYVSL